MEIDEQTFDQLAIHGHKPNYVWPATIQGQNDEGETVTLEKGTLVYAYMKVPKSANMKPNTYCFCVCGGSNDGLRFVGTIPEKLW